MNFEFKKKILNNTFIDQLRIHMNIDEMEYEKLCVELQNLAKDWRGNKLIDKELTLALYSMPLMVRNIYLNLTNSDQLDFVNRLEDIWVELDELVTDCFAD